MTPAELKVELETIKYYYNCEITLILTEQSEPKLSICFKNAHYEITNLIKQNTDCFKTIAEAINFFEKEFRIES